MQKLSRRSALKRTVAAAGVPFIVGSSMAPAQAVPPTLVPWYKRIHTDLYNFHLRVPWWLTGVNDLTIVVYGWFPNGVNDIVKPYNNGVWGLPTITLGSGRYWHPFWALPRIHPGWGWQALWIKYAGGIVVPGAWLHFGIHLRPCRFHVHIEGWWTRNGIPVARAWLWHIYKIRFPGWWLYQFRNPRVYAPPEFEFEVPTDGPRYLYNARYFIPAADKLPRLDDLLPEIPPEQFGGTGWQALQEPTEHLELQPDATTSFLIPYNEDPNPGVEPPPPVFQCGLRETEPPPGLPPEEMLNDPDTASIGIDRAAVEPRGDTNGDGVVGYPDYNVLAQQWGRTSVDNNP